MLRILLLCAFLVLNIIPAAGSGESSPSSTGAPNMDAIHSDGEPLFLSETEIHRRMAGSSRPCIACDYASSPAWVERSVAVLDEQFERARARGGELECHEPLRQTFFEDGEPFPRDLQSRLPRVSVSLIGTVLELKPGWLFGDHAAAQVARVRVDVVLRSKRYPVASGSEVVILVPYGELRTPEARLCTERGWWPMVSVNDRLLVNGKWGRVPPGSYLRTMDLFRIVGGQLVDSGLPDVDLGAVRAEDQLLREAGGETRP